MSGNKRILMSGNEAIAEGAIQAGCEFYAGYPITPQNELTAYMALHMPQRKKVFIQAESELAAINMVFGAAASGVRAMTSSSSPGISLKQEGISYIAGAELPAVIVNVMRAGPGLGNITPAQSDYFQATRGGGHGDYRCIVLAPDSVQEAYCLMSTAFDLADHYRNPVIILSDGMLGQMMEPIDQNIKFKNKAYDKPWALTGCKGRKPNIVASFRMDTRELEKLNLHLQEKYSLIQKSIQQWEAVLTKDAQVVVVAYGGMSRIAKSAISQLRKEGIKAGLLRPISLWPFPRDMFGQETPAGVKYLVVEMSYGQMVEDVQLAINGKRPVSFLGRAGGGIPSEQDIIKHVKKLSK